jgi:hypothetical protein
MHDVNANYLNRETEKTRTFLFPINPSYFFHIPFHILRGLILSKSVKGNETLFPNWQKESWQTFEDTSGYVRPERVNKWPNSMTDI